MSFDAAFPPVHIPSKSLPGQLASDPAVEAALDALEASIANSEASLVSLQADILVQQAINIAQQAQLDALSSTGGVFDTQQVKMYYNPADDTSITVGEIVPMRDVSNVGDCTTNGTDTITIGVAGIYAVYAGAWIRSTAIQRLEMMVNGMRVASMQGYSPAHCNYIAPFEVGDEIHMQGVQTFNPTLGLTDAQYQVTNRFSATKVQEYEAFDPEAGITWHSLFWAEGTAFKALGLSDGGAVASWVNETGETDAGGVLGPVYEASTSGLGNRPSVDFTAAGSYCKALGWTVDPDYTNGVSIVAVNRTALTTGGIRVVCDGSTGSSNALFTNATQWSMFAGATAGGGSAGVHDNFGTVLVGHFDGANSDLEITGTATVTAGNPGSEQLDGDFYIGSDKAEAPAAAFGGHIAFLGIYEGDIRLDANYKALEGYLYLHYGTRFWDQ
jgi:hypothetical protein